MEEANGTARRNGIDTRPAVLISYAYLGPVDLFEKTHRHWRYRELILDSGAWSAHTLGKEIRLHEYIAAAKRIKAADKRLRGIFTLDVIGDWRTSMKNTEAMWKAGLEVIPVYHHGEPWDVLVGMARDYPKIAIGGIAKHHFAVKYKFAEQCFARVWPKPIHGLGYGAEEFLSKFPFHSVDAASWEMGPAAFGRWLSFGGEHLRVSCKARVSLENEARHYVRLEHKARGQWSKVIAGLDGFTPNAQPTVYLVVAFREGSFNRMGIERKVPCISR
jgi:hypothetical protein